MVVVRFRFRFCHLEDFHSHSNCHYRCCSRCRCCFLGTATMATGIAENPPTAISQNHERGRSRAAAPPLIRNCCCLVQHRSGPQWTGIRRTSYRGEGSTALRSLSLSLSLLVAAVQLGVRFRWRHLPEHPRRRHSLRWYRRPVSGRGFRCPRVSTGTNSGISSALSTITPTRPRGCREQRQLRRPFVSATKENTRSGPSGGKCRPPRRLYRFRPNRC